MSASIPRPPKHLGEAGAALWRAVMRDFEIGAADQIVLQSAGEAADRAKEARERVTRDGSFVQGRYGLRSHPGLAVERDSRLAMLRALRELGLSLAEPSRPPTRWRGK